MKQFDQTLFNRIDDFVFLFDIGGIFKIVPQQSMNERMRKNWPKKHLNDNN